MEGSMRAIAVAVVLACGVADVTAQGGGGQRIQARSGDLIVVTGNDVVRVVRKRDAQVRAIFDSGIQRLVLLIDYATAGQPPDGRVDDMRHFEEVTPPWPFGERWEGFATLHEYVLMSGQGNPVWLGIATPMGLVQFGRAQDLSPFADAPPIASLAFRSGGGSRVAGVPFDIAERQAAAGTLGSNLVVEGPTMVPGGPPQGNVGGQQPIRVGSNLKPPPKIHDVRPVYPDAALAARVTGAVIIEAIIGTDGTVTDAKV